jgi:hypothetical protein
MPDLTVSSNVDSLLSAADYAAMRTLLGIREVLTANRTYFVRTDGNDNNTGLVDSSGGAFRNIQKGIDVAASLDISIYTVTIRVGAGTWAEDIILKRPLGAGDCILEGDTTTPSNVILTGNGSHAVTFDQPGVWLVRGFRPAATGTGAVGAGIRAGRYSIIRLSNMSFGACAGSHVFADGGGIEFLTNYTVAGGSTGGGHWQAHQDGLVRASSRTVTITGTPAFAAGWAWTDRGLGTIEAFGMTFSGSATGRRFNIGLNSIIFTNGTTPSTYLPGNTTGTNDGTAVYN